MRHLIQGILVLVLCQVVAAAQNAPQDQPTPAEQYDALAKEFQAAGRGLWEAKTDDERAEAATRGAELPAKFLELAEKNPADPVALDALTQAVNVEIWLMNNTLHPGLGKESPATRAIAQLLKDHVESERVGETCRRMSYGFRKECETFLRAVLEKNPHAEVQGLACLRLAQFLSGRLNRLDLLDERSEMSERYQGFFGQEYLDELRKQDRNQVLQEAEMLFERAEADYGDVKLPYGGTVGETAQTELFAIRHLAVGKEAPEIEAADQDGTPFKLSDYRGKVVLLYFWAEY